MGKILKQMSENGKEKVKDEHGVIKVGKTLTRMSRMSEFFEFDSRDSSIGGIRVPNLPFCQATLVKPYKDEG